MKFTCCCITCIFGEEKPEKTEEEQLISSSEDVVPCTAKVKEPVFLSSNETKHKSTSRETDDEAKVSRALDIIKKHKIFLPPRHDSKPKEAKLTDTVPIDLKISITKLPHRDLVKIFVVEATNVIPTLLTNTSDFGSLSPDEPLLVQVRSKLIPSEVRGHSNKYKVYDAFGNTIKFSNECLQSLTIAESLSQQLRVRLYNVCKPKRDILLGEYTLDLACLELSTESDTTIISLRLHETESDDAVRPVISKIAATVRQSASEPAFQKPGFMRAFSTGSTKPKVFSFPEVGEKEDKPRPYRKSTSSQPDRRTPSTPISSSIPEEISSAIEGETQPFGDLRKAFHERKENLSELETASEEVVSEASSFADLSQRLKEKYEKKQAGRKLQD